MSNLYQWKPVVKFEDMPEHIKQGDEFIARWKNALGVCQYCIAYYGQFGDCFIKMPLGYDLLSIDNIWPDEWCDIPGTTNLPEPIKVREEYGGC